MKKSVRPQNQNKVKIPVLIEPLISTLNNIQSKIDTAVGAATALELRLRIIAQLEPKVQAELKKQNKSHYYKVDLIDLIYIILEIFKDRLDSTEEAKIRNCRMPRNKVTHGSFAELMIELNGEALGREIDPHTRKRIPLGRNDIIEGAICIGQNHGLEDFSKRAKEATVILENKILRTLKQ